MKMIQSQPGRALRLIEKYFPIILLVLTLSPLLYVGLFSFPSADDFCFAFELRTRGFIPGLIHYYYNWTGRFSSVILLNISPLVYDSIFLYRFLSIITLSAISISTYLFFKGFFTGGSKFPIIICSLILFLFFYQLPELTEAIYWYTGATVYTYAIITFCFLVFCLINYLTTKNKSYLVLSLILTIFSSGFNESATLIFIFTWLIIFGLSLSLGSRKFQWTILTILIITILFGVASLFAPGNFERMNASPKGIYDIFNSLFLATYSTIRHLIRWFPIVGVGGLFLFGTITNLGFIDTLNIHVKSVFQRINPIFNLLFFFILIVLGFFPSFYSLGVGSPSRNVNFMYFIFLVGFFSFVFHIVIYFNIKDLPNNAFRVCMLISLILILIFSLFNTGEIKGAYKDILSGAAHGFYFENIQRVETMRMIDNEISLSPLLNQPSSIYHSDITEDSLYWENVCLAQYFGKSKVFLSGCSD